MDVVHQVLKIDIDWSLGIDGRLLRSNQVEELHDSNRKCLKLLWLDHQLSHLDVFDELLNDDRVQVRSLSHVPPVFAAQTCILVVSQVLNGSTIITYLEYGAKLLLMDWNLLKIEVDPLIIVVGHAKTCVQNTVADALEDATLVKPWCPVVGLDDAVLEHLRVLAHGFELYLFLIILSIKMWLAHVLKISYILTYPV